MREIVKPNPDCAHYYDFVPSLGFDGVYRDVEYVLYAGIDWPAACAYADTYDY